MTAVDAETDEPSNYEYVTTRVRMRKAQLYDEDDYRKLVRMEPNEIARFMEESSYGDEINRLGARHSGVDLIEYALYENMARHFRDIVRWSKGSLKHHVVTYLRRYDAFDVKTVLRGIHTGATEDEIRADLIPAGELGDDLLDELVEADAVEQVVEALAGTRYGEPLQEASREYDDTGVLAPLETAVDRAYYRGLLGDDGELASDGAVATYREFLRAEIDITNVRNALRAAGSDDVDPDDYFVEGGDLFDRDELARLAENREELLNALRDSGYGAMMEDAIEALEETDSLVAFDRALDRLLVQYSERMTNLNPLSIAPVIAYILAKEIEVTDIRGIARGREAGLSVEEIEEEVVI